MYSCRAFPRQVQYAGVPAMQDAGAYEAGLSHLPNLKSSRILAMASAHLTQSSEG